MIYWCESVQKNKLEKIESNKKENKIKVKEIDNIEI